MTFASRLTRCPRAYEPDRAAELAGMFAGEGPEIAGLLAATGGCSPYLRTLAEREADWLRAALAGAPEDAFGGILGDVAALERGALQAGLRQAKRRVALLVGLADLGGVWTLEQATRALTDFADAATDKALRELVAFEIGRGKLAGLTEADIETAGGYSVIAMGKMGAYELNYSSDIDLICLFDETRVSADDFHELRAGFVRITRRMTALLSDITAEGYVFRTDLRLRPDASVTPVVISMDAAEHYYESLGRTWERAAYIKARPCAGDIA
ncbi:MAG: glutamine-synthetase adenylyltransferase, partial [Alphaproteobacteria bacterium]|nr:glutamine-synthetase adenylyltransferase [Alphaproteobacteria bacterium]